MCSMYGMRKSMSEESIMSTYGKDKIIFGGKTKWQKMK